MTVGHKVYSAEQEQLIDEKIRALQTQLRVAQLQRFIDEVKAEKAQQQGTVTL